MRQVTPDDASGDAARAISRHVKFGQTGFVINPRAACPSYSVFGIISHDIGKGATSLAAACLEHA